MTKLPVSVKVVGVLQMRMNKSAFYILSFTWGLPLTLMGCLVAGVLVCLGYRPKKFGYSYYFEIGTDWGGLELGLFFLTDTSPTHHLKCHEFGHGLQNCLYGIFMIPIVCIPSAIRYWYREVIWRISPKKYYSLPEEYDAIWFEGQATNWGIKMINIIKVL